MAMGDSRAGFDLPVSNRRLPLKFTDTATRRQHRRLPLKFTDTATRRQHVLAVNFKKFIEI